MNARQEIHMGSPKTNSALFTRRITMKPRCARSNSSCGQKVVASVVRVEACGPVTMMALIVCKNRSGPTEAGNLALHIFLASARSDDLRWLVGGAELGVALLPRKSLYRERAG